MSGRALLGRRDRALVIVAALAARGMTPGQRHRLRVALFGLFGTSLEYGEAAPIPPERHTHTELWRRCPRCRGIAHGTHVVGVEPTVDDLCHCADEDGCGWAGRRGELESREPVSVQHRRAPARARA